MNKLNYLFLLLVIGSSCKSHFQSEEPIPPIKVKVLLDCSASMQEEERMKMRAILDSLVMKTPQGSEIEINPINANIYNYEGFSRKTPILTGHAQFEIEKYDSSVSLLFHEIDKQLALIKAYPNESCILNAIDQIGNFIHQDSLNFGVIISDFKESCPNFRVKGMNVCDSEFPQEEILESANSQYTIKESLLSQRFLPIIINSDSRDEQCIDQNKREEYWQTIWRAHQLPNGFIFKTNIPDDFFDTRGQ